MLKFDEWNALLVEKELLKKMGAGVMVERPDGKVLLLRRSMDSTNPGRWCFPGGGVDGNEKAMDAAVRECGEEIGGLPPGGFTGERSVFQIGNFRFVTFRYECTDDSWEPTLNPEHTEWAWCSPNSISTYETIEMAGQRPVIDAAMDMINYKHSCVMVNAPREIAKRVERWAVRHIDPADLSLADSFESVSHATVMYGMRDKTAENVLRICRSQAPVRCSIGKLDAFKNPEFDVLIARISSEDVRRLRSWLRTLPHELPFRDYRPHMTIAYLKPGASDKYVGLEWDLQGASFEANSAVFSGWQGEERDALLAGDRKEFCPDFADEKVDGWAG